MGTPRPTLRVLMVDTTADEAALLDGKLEEGGFAVSSRRVAGNEPPAEVLASGAWDVAIVAWRVGAAGKIGELGGAPGVGAVIALCDDDEDAMVAAVRAGADDVIRRDRAGRLAAVVRRQLAAADRAARTGTAAGLEESAAQLSRFSLESECTVLLSPEAVVRSVNPSGLPLLQAHSADEVVGRSLLTWVRPEYRDAFRTFMARSVGGATGTLEFQIAAPNGADSWIELRAMPFRDAAGRVTAIFGVARDITARRLADAEREAALERLRLVVEGTETGLFDWDLRTNRVRYSDEWKRLLGYEPGEIGDDLAEWERLTHPADRERTLATTREFLASRRSVFSAEFRMRHKDGDWRWILATGTATRDAEGVPDRMIGMHRDITARWREEQQAILERAVLDLIARDEPLEPVLNTLLQGYQALLEDTVGSVLLLTADGRHLEHGAAPDLPAGYVRAIDGAAIGPQAGSCGTAAYSGETVVAADIATDERWAPYRDLALAHGLRACWSVPIRAGSETVLGTFAMYYRAVRAPRSYELQLVKDGARVAGIAIVRDRRARERRELLAQEQKARAEAEAANREISHLLDRMTDGFVALDREWRYTYVNRAAGELFARRPEDLLGKHIWTEFPDGVGQPFHRAYERAMAEQVTIRFEDHYAPWDRWFENVVYPSPEGIAIFFHEITDRKHAEQRTAAAELLNEQVISGVQEGIVVFDRELRYLAWNPFMEAVSGIPASELLGRTLAEAFPSLATEREPLLRRVLAGEWLRFPDEHLAPPQAVRDLWLSTSWAPLRDLQGSVTGIVGTLADVTERRAAEQAVLASREQLRELGRRLEAVREEHQARIARDIHDALGQELTALRIDLVRMRSRRRLAAVLREGLDGAIGLVDSAIETTRRVAGELRPPALDDLGLSAAIEWQVRRFAEATRLRCEVRSDDDLVDLPRGAALAAYRICQEALTNVARHAGAQAVNVTLTRGAEELRMEIRDDGTGIAAGNISAGIGLLGMRERAEAWGGTVAVGPGGSGGTVVLLRLPLAGTGGTRR